MLAFITGPQPVKVLRGVALLQGNFRPEIGIPDYNVYALLPYPRRPQIPAKFIGEIVHIRLALPTFRNHAAYGPTTASPAARRAALVRMAQSSS